MKRLAADWFDRDATAVAPALVGKVLSVVGSDGVHRSGRITETEAYTSDDPASHSFAGKTRRNATMFGAPGCWYVYLIYGLHHCLNVVTGAVDDGQAVLIRSLDWVHGPGRLTKALAIDRTRDGAAADVFDDGFVPSSIEVTPRVGITKAVEWPRRFVMAASEASSRAGGRWRDVEPFAGRIAR
jgi:DNA-3-methyladenine glycosylase